MKIFVDQRKRASISAINVIKYFLCGMVVFAVGVALTINIAEKWYRKRIEKAWTMSGKHLSLFMMMNRWVDIKQQGKNLKTFFEKEGYRTIAIYGMGYAGNRLVKELESSEIEVKYAIDRNMDTYTEVKLCSMEEELEAVDAIIVTPVFFYRSIKKELEEKIDAPIISLEDILYEM